MKHSPKRLVVGILLVIALGLVYAGATHRWFGQVKSVSPASARGERKVLYWYDAMNPQHHSSQPGEGAGWHGPGSAVRGTNDVTGGAGKQPRLCRYG